MRRLFSTLLFITLLMLVSARGVTDAPPQAASAMPQLDEPQLDTWSYRVVPYAQETGRHTGNQLDTQTVWRSTVQVPHAAWVRLVFEDYQLGQDSYLTITSRRDGSYQRLDATSLRQWRNRSAFFNGDTVEVELTIAPQDADVFVQLKEVQAGESEPPQPNSPETQCGPTDDRVRTTDKAIGRFIFNPGPDQYAACTGWLTSNNSVLTAGHCADFGTDGQPEMIEFNVPLSSATGAVSFSVPSDQYPIDASHFDFHNNGPGDDWGIFEVLENSNTYLLPVHTQQAFYRLALADDADPATVRVTGYGIDSTPPESHRVLQTHSGSYLGETMSGSTGYVSYSVDTESGNSGSPVISRTGTVSITVGIHTNGGCTATGDSNSGTSFANTSLATAISTFYYPVVEHVDKAHPVMPTVDGSIFRPWSSVNLGTYFAANNSVVSIVTGSYNEVLTITKPLTLTAPVGMVTIGQ